MQNQKLFAFEWIGCIAWILLWGSIAYIAFSQGSINLGGGKAGLGAGQFEGVAAIAVSFIAFGAAALGVDWLFRVSRYRLQARIFLGACWLISIGVYILLTRT